MLLPSPAAHVQVFRNELSQLNTFMAAYSLKGELRFRLREFLHETVHLRDAEMRQKLLSKALSRNARRDLTDHQSAVDRQSVVPEKGRATGATDRVSSEACRRSSRRGSYARGLMYISNRGTALYAALARHPGTTWGDDLLLNNKGLQLNFCAVAVTYLWVFTLDGPGLHAAIAKSPASASQLKAVARRWTIRRAVVRYAERECHRRGGVFRNRYTPIYAKELAMINTQRRAEVWIWRRNKNMKFSQVAGITRLANRSINAMRTGPPSSAPPGAPSSADGTRLPTPRQRMMFIPRMLRRTNTTSVENLTAHHKPAETIASAARRRMEAQRCKRQAAERRAATMANLASH